MTQISIQFDSIQHYKFNSVNARCFTQLNVILLFIARDAVIIHTLSRTSA